MKDDLTLKPVYEMIPVEKWQTDNIRTDLDGAALYTDIRQIGLSEFFEGKIMRRSIGLLIAAGRGQWWKPIIHFLTRP